jgi:ABC-type transporter Mla subunit MlaD
VIGTVDADGVALAAIQALEQRTAELRASAEEVNRLRAEVAALRTQNQDVLARLEALEARQPR